LKTCDICGCDESALSDDVPGTTLKINLDEALKPLVGKNAGAICRTLELPYEPPYQSVIDAATQIGYDEDRYMSTWSFLTLWLDGTTLWLSEDQTAKALVYPSGEVQINQC